MGGLPRTLLCVQRGFPAPLALGRDFLHTGDPWHTQCFPMESSVRNSPRQGSMALAHRSPPCSRLSWTRLQAFVAGETAAPLEALGPFALPLEETRLWDEVLANNGTQPAPFDETHVW